MGIMAAAVTSEVAGQTRSGGMQKELATTSAALRGYRVICAVDWLGISASLRADGRPTTNVAHALPAIIRIDDCSSLGVLAVVKELQPM